jgi:hypothetical protein
MKVLNTYLTLAILVLLYVSSRCVEKVQDFDVTPSLTDEELIDLIQERTFQYFWDGAEPHSGMARERIHMDGIYPENDQNVVTTGGTGFGLMALLVGIERGYISRAQGYQRIKKIVDFLEKADRFHGVWPHWLEGDTGKVRPFGWDDNGGDLVESAFLIQGLLTVRQYFVEGLEEERELAQKIDQLWKDVEWSWHLKEDENVLLWHWSPDFGFVRNHAIRGYDETLITYVLAASSPTFSVNANHYQEGWARNGGIKNDGNPYGISLTLRHNGAEEWGGPLFWAHYSYLGLDPRGLKDQYADYWEHNVNHTLINREWCIANPNGYKGYGENSWGLTASYSLNFYAAHRPGDDLGVISPTAAISSIPYTPEYSLQVMRHWYETFGEKLLGPYGFYDAFSETENWFPQKYLAIDQGPMVVMIENYRSGLLWDLFMSSPEIKVGLQKLGFQSPHF